MAKIFSYEQRTETPTLRGVQQPRALAGEADMAVPRALAGFSQDIRRAGVDIVEADEAHAKAWTAQALSKARLDWTANYEKRKAAAQPGAPGFTPALLTDFDTYAGEAIEGAPTPTAKAFFRARLNDFREDLGVKGIQFEAGARVDYQETAHAQGIQFAQLLMNEDPSQYQVALAEQMTLINESAMGPEKKSAMTKKAVDSISGAAVWTQIQQSPTNFLASIGMYADPKTGRALGDLKGITGNTAFDAMTFEDRVKYFDMAIREKAKIDSDAEDAINGKDVKSNRSALRRMYELLDAGDTVAAEKYAIDAHKRGLLSNEDLKGGWSKAREVGRQEGPDSEYERSRNYVIQSLDPGPMVQDPIGRQRLAEATDMFDRWFGQSKRTDEEVMIRGREIVKQFRFVDMSHTVLALPQPRSAAIRRTPDAAGIMKDVLEAGTVIQDRRTRGELTEQEYVEEMKILDRWRKTAEGVK